MVAEMILASVFAAALSVSGSAPPPQLVAQLAACTTAQLSYGLDPENGQFDGMSHSGALLVVRNLGPQPCRTGALPRLQFQDGANRALAAARRPPPGMHPGPVLLPVALAPGAEATSELYWVEGDVYDGHNCIHPAKMRIGEGAGAPSINFQGQMCGPAGKPVAFDQSPLKTDPILKPAM